MRFAGTNNPEWGGATAQACAAVLTLASVGLLGTLAWSQPQAALSQPVTASKAAPKQAEKAAGRGDKAATEGKLEQALKDYQDAVKAAPGDVGIARRAAAVRAQVVQKIVDQAEVAALDGDLARATELMYKALQIDPGNTIVAERLAQMKQMPRGYLPVGDRED